MSPEKKLTYAKFVQILSQEHPGLTSLSSFLNQERRLRAEPSVTCIDYPRSSDGSEPPPVISNSQVLKSLGVVSSDCHGRIIVVEDINGPLIEELGATLDLDPFFFAAHLAPDPNGPINKLLASAWQRLPSQFANGSNLHLYYKRVLDLGDIDTFEHGRHERFESETNTPRDVIPLPYSLGKRQLAILSAYCSITLKLREDSWICLILVDGAVTSLKEVQNGGADGAGVKIDCKELQRRFNEDEVPTFSSFRSSDYQPEQSPNSYPERLIRAFRIDPPNFRQSKPSLLSVSYHVIRCSAVEWIGHIRLMFIFLRHYEFSARGTKGRLSEANLFALNRWRLHCYVTQSRLVRLAEFVTHWAAREEGGGSGSDDRYADLLRDIDGFSTQTSDLIRALDETMQLVTSMIQLLDARQAILEAVNVRRLTYIALVFVPLSWLAGLFSMADGYSPGGSDFWVYWASAVPLVFAILAVAVSPYRQIWKMLKNLNRALEKKKKEGEHETHESLGQETKDAAGIV